MRMQGVHLSREYSTGDSLEDIEWEFSRQKMNQDTVNSVALMRDTLKLIITGVELGNNRLGPFLNLDGWSSGMTSDMNRYDHCLERIYKQYFRKGSMNPIVELGFLMVSSMFMHHFKARFTGPPPVQRNVPFQVPKEQQQQQQHTMPPNQARRPRMRPPSQSFNMPGPGMMPSMPSIPINMPRMGAPRPPPMQQSTPEISEVREASPPKIIDTSTQSTSKKAASTFSVQKEGEALNFNDLSDDDEA